ncbi:MAG: Uma2 family endonuclease [Lewinellaceae bacterium]|nr:Uma2 family endonuclease [Lewinellaceae bacterium]
MMHEELLEGPVVVEAAPEMDYEIERNKPMPNIIHGFLQHKIGVLLDQLFADKFMFISELSLDSTPPSTPDICIYPKRKLDVRTVVAREKEMPLTTIEILSPSQSVNELMHKAWDIYFPLGVKSAWIVVPELKGIHIVLPDNRNYFFNTGTLTDQATGIEIPVERIFEDLL